MFSHVVLCLVCYKEQFFRTIFLCNAHILILHYCLVFSRLQSSFMLYPIGLMAPIWLRWPMLRHGSTDWNFTSPCHPSKLGLSLSSAFEMRTLLVSNSCIIPVFHNENQFPCNFHIAINFFCMLVFPFCIS